MAPICATEEVLNKTMSAATTATDARSLSGHSARHAPDSLHNDGHRDEFEAME
jgi:hypothetical protein